MYTLIRTSKKCFHPSQTLFWRNEPNLCDQTILQKLIHLILMMKKCYKEFFTIVMYVHSMNPSQHRASRSFSKRLCEGIGPNIKKDDS